MGRIIEQAVITLDGQISTPQDWLATRWAGEFEERSTDLLASVDALLYGRVSYESHAEVWPSMEEVFGDYAVRMNTIPKYVASRTLTEVSWNATLLEGDAIEAVADLKQGTDGDLLKIGTSGSFSRTLLEHGLVDEYLFWMFPVIAGHGERLYAGIDTTELELLDVSELESGIVGLTYAPNRV